jgi:hypothetical protein
MEWKAVVIFYGNKAYYEVVHHDSGIYHARLIKYEGSSDTTPPECVTLVKSVSRWTGSHHEQELLDELGSAIEFMQRETDTEPSS